MKSKIFLLMMIFILSLNAITFASGEETYSDDLQEFENIEDTYIYDPQSYITKTYKGTIINAGPKYEEQNIYTGQASPYQDVRVKTNDEGKTIVVSVKYQLSYFDNPAIVAKELKKGDKVYVTVAYDGNGAVLDSYIGYISNERYLVAMLIIYVGAIILIGGLNGVRALIGLAITILAVFFGMIPLIYNGASPVLVAILVSIGIIIVTFIIIAGFSKKTLSAILGTAGGIIVAGLFAIIFGELMKLTGACEHAQNLSMIENGSRFNFEGIMIAGIIVGALGACMDVGMSISSALHELSVEGNGMTIKKLIKSGMNIGKDVMGTMTNTLILAYVGSSLIVILLFKGFGFEAYEIANNMELVLEEVLRAIAGSFGLVTTIPITALVSAMLMGKKENDR